MKAFAQAQSPLNDEQYRWLYESLFAQPIRENFAAESFKSFRVHLKDSNQNFPSPENIIFKNLTPPSKIQGTMTYVSIVKKRYAYDVLATPVGLQLTVRVHFKDPTAEDKISFAEKIQQAEDLWNASRVATDFNYQFKFIVTQTESEADFSVRILNSTRGPYDMFWGRDWIPQTIAHEIGHMMGLADEYQTVTGEFDCYKPSLMCAAWSGALMPHHYYFILRRLIRS